MPAAVCCCLILSVRDSQLAAGVTIGDASFQHYTGGVFSDPACGCNGKNCVASKTLPIINHAVAIVGYGADVWIVKNRLGVGLPFATSF